MAEAVRSEDVLGQKFDKCIVDTMIKTVSGAAVGTVLSFIGRKSLRGSRWPISLFTGIGFGMGIANCNNEFKYPHLVQVRRVKTSKEETT